MPRRLQQRRKKWNTELLRLTGRYHSVPFPFLCIKLYWHLSTDTFSELSFHFISHTGDTCKRHFEQEDHSWFESLLPKQRTKFRLFSEETRFAGCGQKSFATVLSTPKKKNSIRNGLLQRSRKMPSKEVCSGVLAAYFSCQVRPSSLLITMEDLFQLKQREEANLSFPFGNAYGFLWCCINTWSWPRKATFEPAGRQKHYLFASWVKHMMCKQSATF